MAQPATARARAAKSSPLDELARFFPEATPVRIPIQFARSSNENKTCVSSDFTESAVIEFGTAREVLFTCNCPLEFADILRLRTSDGSLDAEASVVAVQYRPTLTLVAARFLTSVPNWIVKS